MNMREADDGDPRRDKTREFLQELGIPEDVEEYSEPCILTGWAVVTEWMDVRGRKFLIRGFDHNIASWHAKGMIREALMDDWDD